MFLSIFDIFKIGIGPSSSHTMGPMTAAVAFLDALRSGLREPGAGDVAHVTCSLHGSLSFTGKGHATDRAVMLGLCGFLPATIDPDKAEAAEAALYAEKTIHPGGLPPLRFDPATDLVFDYGPPLPGHANGMILRGFDAAGTLFMEETYYSIGGGFVMTAAELDAQNHGGPKAFHAEKEAHGYPYPFGSAAEMLAMGQASGKSIAQMKWANEEAGAPRAEVRARRFTNRPPGKTPSMRRPRSMQSSIAARIASSRACTAARGAPASSLAHFISAMLLPEACPIASISAADPNG